MTTSYAEAHEAFTTAIGQLRAQLTREIAASDEDQILVNGQAVEYLAYSHSPDARRQGYLALVGALETSPNRARYGLLAYATDGIYGDAALDAIGSSYAPAAPAGSEARV